MLEEKSFNFKFLFRRSKCNHCNHTIDAVALIPIFGYILSRGRCNKCHRYIPFIYVCSEVVLALLFIVPSLVYIQFRDFSLYYLLIVFLAPLALYDFKHYKIPNFTLVILLTTGLYVTRFNYVDVIDDLIIITLAHVIYILFDKKIGYGDIKLLSVITLITPTMLFSFILLFSFIVGGFYVIIMEIINSTDNRKIPYVPFVATSTILTFIIYDDLSTIYFGGFL